MDRRIASVLAGAIAAWFSCHAAALNVALDAFTATIERGGIASLTLPDGKVLVGKGPFETAACIARLAREHTVTDVSEPPPWDATAGATLEYQALEALAGGRIAMEVSAAGDELVLRHSARSPEPGVWGVGWSIATIPLACDIIVPAHSGLRLTANTPGSRHQFDYPMAWEAQVLLVAHPDGGGFYVWANDPDRQYKRLVVERHPEGWQVTMYTMPLAPFSERTEVTAPPWQVGVWAGHWREPLRRYRDWAAQAFTLPPRAERGPAWVDGIRGCVIMDLDTELLPLLAQRIDPEQTLLYLPHWRQAGYDRNYPDYTAAPELDPFIDAAHALGFRVMLHVNYFGCDPEHAAYERFAQYQCRKSFEDGALDWWTWDKVDPPIRFAYINPAAKAWRDFFVETMRELCAKHAADALHLDQTLVIYNEDQGRVDGMTMLEGNIALHAALREALPAVALSGEGLNEATFGHEAFAQRHVWGLAHHDGEFSLPHLQAAHPVSSYLFRDRVTLYGYLGMAPPTEGQLYSAWQEAYRHYGIVPTLARPTRAMVESPQWFTRQLFDELAYFHEKRADPAMETDWPEGILFPYRTERDVPLQYTYERQLVSRRFVVSHTLFNRQWWLGEGAIPGWLAFDFENMRALDPGRWYPYFPEPPDRTQPHIEQLPEGLTLDVATVHDRMALFRLRESSLAQVALAPFMADAVTGTRSKEGELHEALGNLHAPDGGQFYAVGNVIHAHPPYKGVEAGMAYARFTVTLPWNALRFRSLVALDPAAVGEDKSDGVRFTAQVRRKDRTDLRGVMVTSAEPSELRLGLRELAGKEVTLELRVDPGPDYDASYDWARWINPIIENDVGKEGTVQVKSAGAGGLNIAVAGDRVYRATAGTNTFDVAVPLPGALYLLPELPRPVAAPYDLMESDYTVTYADGSGIALQAPQYAAVEPREFVIDGAALPGLFVHPPDHGRTLVDIPITLPVGKPVFRAKVRIPLEAPSEGAVLSVEAGGIERGRVEVTQGDWVVLEADLSPWSGKPTVLSLITDADGPYRGDWVNWAAPRIELLPKEKQDG